MFGLGKKKKDDQETKVEHTNREDNSIKETAPEINVKREIDKETKVELREKDNGTEKSKKENKDNKENKDKAVEVPLTYKEFKALKKANYNQIAPKFNKSFLIKNIKTGQIVEIRAASSYHACNIIGWRPRRVKVLEEKMIVEQPKVELRNVESKSIHRGENKTNPAPVTSELPPGLR